MRPWLNGTENMWPKRPETSSKNAGFLMSEALYQLVQGFVVTTLFYIVQNVNMLIINDIAEGGIHIHPLYA